MTKEDMQALYQFSVGVGNEVNQLVAEIEGLRKANAELNERLEKLSKPENKPAKAS